MPRIARHSNATSVVSLGAGFGFAGRGFGCAVRAGMVGRGVDRRRGRAFVKGVDAAVGIGADGNAADLSCSLCIFQMVDHPGLFGGSLGGR